MIIGVPREVKDGECRVALIPGNVQVLKSAGHKIRIEKNAGRLSGFSDAEYRKAGAELVGRAGKIWKDSDLSELWKLTVPV